MAAPNDMHIEQTMFPNFVISSGRTSKRYALDGTKRHAALKLVIPVANAVSTKRTAYLDPSRSPFKRSAMSLVNENKINPQTAAIVSASM